MLQPTDRLVADANTGWTQHEAMRVVRAVRDVDVYIEQPCLTYEECLAVRRHTDHPFVFDENIDSLDVLLRAKADLAMDVVNLKISKLGGLTKTKQARDLCVSMGIAMTLEDSWGGDITTAAIAHLAHSTPEEFRFTSTDFNSYVTVSTADGAPMRDNGFMKARPHLASESRRSLRSLVLASWRSDDSNKDRRRRALLSFAGGDLGCRRADRRPGEPAPPAPAAPHAAGPISFFSWPTTGRGPTPVCWATRS